MSKKFFIETYGCTSNKFDSEKMIGILLEKGYSLVSEKDADYIIINSCGVKATTEDKVISRIKELDGAGRRIMIAGCLTRINPERIKKVAPGFCGMIDTRSIHLIGEFFDRIDSGQKNIIFSSNEPAQKPLLAGFSFSPVISIVKIAEGCCSKCSFCATKLARGELYSFRPDTIREAVKNGVKSGFKEFHITSEDASAYGRDIGINLPDLLESICRIDGEFKIRVGMMNPLHFLIDDEGLNRIIEAYKNDKVFKFLHLCVQSGSDSILKIMGRGYSVNDARRIVRFFRKEIPEITIWSDIIAGFPGETDRDFEETLKLVNEIGFDFINISRYTVRKGTRAAKMKQISSEIKKERSRKISNISDEIALRKNMKWVGWRGSVIVDEYNEKKGNFIGRNYAYKPIVIIGKAKLGDIANIKVIGAEKTHLLGRICT